MCLPRLLLRSSMNLLLYKMSETVRNSLKKVVKGSALIFIATTVSMVLWFIVLLIIIRNTTPAEFGLYSIALTVENIFSIIALAGFGAGVTRFISVALGKNDHARVRDTERSAITFSTISGFVFALLLFSMSWVLARYIFYTPELGLSLRIVSLYILFSATKQVLISITRGRGDVRLQAYVSSIGQPFFYLLILLPVLKYAPSFNAILWAYVLSMVLTWAISSIIMKMWHGISVFSYGGTLKKELLMFSLPLLGVIVMGLVFKWTDTLMLARYAGPETVGVYRIAVSLVRLMPFTLQAIAFIFMPIAGEMFAKGQSEELKRTYQVLSKWVFVSTLPVFFILAFFPEMTITFLFEERYVPSASPLRLLLVGYGFELFFGLNVMLMIVMKMQKTLMHNSLVGIILNIVLNYVTIKRLGMGMDGAAMSTAISMGVTNTLNAVSLYRQEGVHPFSFKYVKHIAATVFAGLVVYVSVKTLPFHMLLMPVYLVIFGLGYMAAIILSHSIEKEDLDLLEGVGRRTGVNVAPLLRVLKRFYKE